MSAAKINSPERINSLTTTANDEIKKAGYLRKLKDRFSKQIQPQLISWDNVKYFLSSRLKCRPYRCRCPHRRLLLHSLLSLDSKQTMKKKFFVLKKENDKEPARLEYYDSEKKWKMGSQPKRNIILKTCFNINRKLDTKHKHAIALYTKDDCFTIILENEEELEEWLQALLELQHGEEALARNELPKPSFEHVWQVNIRNRGLASTKNILGLYHLCLTSQVLSLVKLNTDSPEIIEFPLMSIRRCGHSYCFFFMELGRSAVTGAGELWMQTEDVIIAQNMHEAILNAMRSRAKDDIVPRPRLRSCSTNESSKPISVHVRRQASVCGPNVTPIIRERSDSVPARSHTLGDSQSEVCSRPKHLLHLDIPRPHSMFVQSFSSTTTSGSTLHSPGSGTNITDSPCSSFSIDEHEALQFDMFSSHYLHSTTPENGANLLETSLSEELPLFEDYLPMTPPDTSKSSGISKSNERTDDGYMDMTSPSSLPPSGLSRSRTPSSSHSPNLLGLTSHSNKMNSPSVQTDYLTMSTVPSSSPESDGYMAMSPVGSSRPDGRMISPTSVKSHLIASSPSSSSSLQHRKISFEEIQEGYVPMTPLSSSKPTNEEGYIEMASGNHSLKSSKDDSYLAMSPVSSVISGTPSTNIRFSEFQLEKVRAYFTPNEEEESLVRAYSVGSRLPKPNKLANRADNETETSRVRAFSVGSKVGLKFGKQSNNQSADNESKGKKSNSAPLLGSGTPNNSWSGTSSLFSSQNGKAKQNEDLMELDFAKIRPHSSSKLETTRKSDSSNLDNNQQGINSNIRPRSNSRSSCSRPSKGEMLQVIGEKSDVKVTSEGPKRNVASDGRRNHQLTISSESNKKNSLNSELVKNDGSSSVSKAYQENLDLKKQEASLDIKTIKTNVTHPLNIQVETPSSQKQTESPPSSGEYVNIDLSKQYQKQISSKCLNVNSSDSKGINLHSSGAKAANNHDYVNLQVGNSTGDKKLQSSNFSSLPRYKSIASPAAPGTVSNSSKLMNSCKDYVTNVQKQVSVSLTSLPNSSDTQTSEDPVKISSPTNCSPVVTKTSLTDKILGFNPLDLLNSSTLNHTDESRIKSEEKTKGFVSHKNPQCFSTETLYENINFGHTHSRPSSISSDRELNYASLDLVPSLSGDEDVPCSPCSVRSCPASEENKKKLSYAKIDFIKSEGLRTTSNTVREIHH